MVEHDEIDDSNRTDQADESTEVSDTTRVTRRHALVLAGSGLAAGAMGTAQAGNHDTPTQANNHDALVHNRGEQFVAKNGGSQVYSGGDFIDAIQAAVDSLTSNRTSKEKVRVVATGNTGTASSIKAVELPSYTTLDVPGLINVNDSSEPWIIPVRAQNAEQVEIQRFNVTGTPRFGIRLSHCSNVIIDDVNMSLSGGLGIRIDGRNGIDTQNVTLNSANISGSSTHAVETYGVDNIDIGTVTATDIDTGCGLLLNDTSNATVNYVNATRCDQGGGYAGFRCANNAGPNITVNQVDAVDCGRGIFTVSGSSGIDISDVYLENNETGVLIQDTRDLTMNGGTITDNVAEGIRIDSRSSNAHPYTRNVTVENLQIDNNDYGIYETGPDTEQNAILNNNLCDNTTADIQTYASNTTVRGNTYCGDENSSSGKTR